MLMIEVKIDPVESIQMMLEAEIIKGEESLLTHTRGDLIGRSSHKPRPHRVNKSATLEL